MKKIILTILLLGVISSIAVQTNSNVQVKNFSTEIKIDENVIYEGEEIYLNVLIKNNSLYKDSVENLTVLDIIKNLKITNSKAIVAQGTYMQFNRDVSYYCTFAPNEEKLFRIPLTFAYSFEGLTRHFRYYPADNYKIDFKYVIDQEILFKSQELNFQVKKNTGKSLELFNKVRQLDTAVSTKYDSEFDIETVDQLSTLVSDYTDERQVELLIEKDIRTRSTLHYKYDDNFFKRNLNYIKRNPGLRNVDYIISKAISFIEFNYKNSKDQKLNELRNLIQTEFFSETELKNKLVSKMDSLLYLRFK